MRIKLSNQNGGAIWSTTHSSKYQSFRTNELRGVALARYDYIEIAWKHFKSPITPIKAPINQSISQPIKVVKLKW